MGDGVFEAESGPVRSYRRTVTVAPGAEGRAHVRQEVELRLALPYFGFLVALPVRRQLRRLAPSRRAMPWWHPPDRLDARAAGVLGSLALLSIVIGYLGTLLTETITYAAAEFHAGRAAQGFALAAVRGDIVLSVVLVGRADRRGRRPVLVGTALAACGCTAVGALAPSLALLAASQVVARGFVTAAAIVLTVMAAEEIPAGSRAYAVSVLAMAAALGSGLAVASINVTALDQRAWRLLFAAALLGVPVARSVGRRLPESRRFLAGTAPGGERRTEAERATARSSHRGRLLLLAVSALLFNVFVAPAAEFQNEFLRTERHFSPGRISLFTIATNTPAGIGVVAGGRLADVRGRRLVGAVGLAGGVGATVAMYLASGWPLWAWSLAGAVVGAAVIPALGVYGPELFPTARRGRANGIITGMGRVGSVVGLLAAGLLSSSSGFGRVGPTLAILALAPVVLALLILVAYPETAGRELEELNPEDAPL
jgi:MFS family permease